jgi:hypothetical protein
MKDQIDLFPDSVENDPKPEIKIEQKIKPAKENTEIFEDSIECYVCDCGNNEIFVDYDELIGMYFVSCSNDSCHIEHEDDNENKAIEKWNAYQMLLHQEGNKNEKSKKEK